MADHLTEYTKNCLCVKKSESVQEKYALFEYNNEMKNATPCGWIRRLFTGGTYGYRLVPTNHPNAGKLLRVRKGSNIYAVETTHTIKAIKTEEFAGHFVKEVPQSDGKYTYYYQLNWTIPAGVNGIFFEIGADNYYYYKSKGFQVTAGKVITIEFVGRNVTTS